eukprot:979843-Amphidinium_carterae.1
MQEAFGSHALPMSGIPLRATSEAITNTNGWKVLAHGNKKPESPRFPTQHGEIYVHGTEAFNSLDILQSPPTTAVRNRVRLCRMRSMPTRRTPNTTRHQDFHLREPPGLPPKTTPLIISLLTP